MDGTTAVGGAPWATGGGSAYVFYHDGSGWSQQARLVGSATDDWENFGCSVAISGDTLIVGANYEDHGTVQSAGAAYVFKRSGTIWSKEARLISSDAQADQWFGYSVAVYGDTAVVGAHPVSQATAGWAYIFQRSGSTWTQRKRLTESESSDAVAVYDRTVVVGDKWDWSVGVYAYRDTSVAGDWSSLSTTRIGASQTNAGDFFGSALAIDGDTLVVGAESADGLDTSSGAAYIYKWNGSTWTLHETLTASDGDFADEFGVSVAISGDIRIVGADMADGGASSSGAAYAYQAPAQFAVSGSVTLSGQSDHSGVTVTFTRVSGTGAIPASVQSNATGAWSQSGFQPGTTYRATPSKSGWTFTPTYRDFSGASSSLGFTGSSGGTGFSGSGTVTLSGQSDHSGVTVTFSQVSGSGTVPSPVQTVSNGSWSQSGFQAGTTYRAEPSKSGWTFTPTYRDFSGLALGLDFSGNSAQTGPVKVFVCGVLPTEGNSKQAFYDDLASIGCIVDSDRTMPDLNAYDILIVTGATYQPMPTFPAATLDAFVSGGKGLIIFEDSIQDYRVPTAAQCNPVAGFANWTQRTGTHAVNYQNPLLRGLGPSSNLTGWTLDPVLKPGADIALEWNGMSVPMAVTFRFGAGRVVFFNDLWAWYGAGESWTGDTSYGYQLMRNAIRFVGPLQPASVSGSSWLLY
jgi:hypothetical protein